MGTIRGGVLPALDKGGTRLLSRSKINIRHHSQAEKREAVISCSSKTKGLLSEDQYAGEDSFDQHYLNGLEKIFEKTEKRCERSHR